MGYLSTSSPTDAVYFALGRPCNYPALKLPSIQALLLSFAQGKRCSILSMAIVLPGLKITWNTCAQAPGQLGGGCRSKRCKVSYQTDQGQRAYERLATRN